MHLTIAFAIQHKSVEILKYLVSHIEYPRLTYRKLLIEQELMRLAIVSNNLKLCQLFCEMALTEVDNMKCYLDRVHCITVNTLQYIWQL